MSVKYIGLLSDTHGFLDPDFKNLFKECDEIWHAGDLGTQDVWDELCTLKPTRGVYGNIDDAYIRTQVPEVMSCEVEGLKILMIHIAGPPGKYNLHTKNLINKLNPGLLICGHSHILKVQYYKEWGHLYMNPGAAGHHGFHVIRTAIRFKIGHGQITQAEVIELGKRGRI